MKATDIHFKTADGHAATHYANGYVFSEEEGRALLSMLAIVMAAPLPVVVRQMSPDGPLDVLSGDFNAIVNLLDAVVRAKQIGVGVTQ